MEKEENQSKEENILKKEDSSDGDTHSEKIKRTIKKMRLAQNKKF